MKTRSGDRGREFLIDLLPLSKTTVAVEGGQRALRLVALAQRSSGDGARAVIAVGML